MWDCKAGIGADSTGGEKDVMKCQIISNHNKKVTITWTATSVPSSLFLYGCPSGIQRTNQSIGCRTFIETVLRHLFFFSSAFCITIFTRDKIRALVWGTGVTSPYHTHKLLPKHTGLTAAKRKIHRTRQHITTAITWKRKKNKHRSFLMSLPIMPNRSDVLSSFYNLWPSLRMLQHYLVSPGLTLCSYLLLLNAAALFVAKVLKTVRIHHPRNNWQTLTLLVMMAAGMGCISPVKLIWDVSESTFELWTSEKGREGN